jgi:hypothetical protein
MDVDLFSMLDLYTVTSGTYWSTDALYYYSSFTIHKIALHVRKFHIERSKKSSTVLAKKKSSTVFATDTFLTVYFSKNLFSRYSRFSNFTGYVDKKKVLYPFLHCCLSAESHSWLITITYPWLHISPVC